MIHAVPQPDMLQGFTGHLTGVDLFFSPEVEEGKFHVLQGGGSCQKVEPLEHEADLAVADIGQVPGSHLVHAGAVQGVASPGGVVETAQDVHEGGFSGTRSAHDGDEFTFADFQVHAPQGGNFYVSHDIGFFNGSQFDAVHVNSSGV